MAGASVNPVDWKVRSGMLQKFFPVTFPAITGRDGAGEVIAAADSSLVGKRVCFLAQRGAGTWSQKIALQASLAVPIPSSMSYEAAASLPLAGISAWVGLVQTACVKPGMRVLIHAAAGGVGSMAVQIARLRGATVIATCSQRNVDFVRELGAQEVIAYDQTAFEEHVRDIDVVFDVIGGDVHRRSYPTLKRDGIIVALAAAPFFFGESPPHSRGLQTDRQGTSPTGNRASGIVPRLFFGNCDFADGISIGSGGRKATLLPLHCQPAHS